MFYKSDMSRTVHQSASICNQGRGKPLLSRTLRSHWTGQRQTHTGHPRKSLAHPCFPSAAPLPSISHFIIRVLPWANRWPRVARIDLPKLLSEFSFAAAMMVCTWHHHGPTTFGGSALAHTNTTLRAAPDWCRGTWMFDNSQTFRSTPNIRNGSYFRLKATSLTGDYKSARFGCAFRASSFSPNMESSEGAIIFRAEYML